MTKENETKKQTKSKTVKASTRKTAASTKKKAAAAPKKTKQTKKTQPARTSASAGWKEKKAEIRQRSKGPRTIAEQKAYREKGPIARFLSANNGFLDMGAVLFFAFAVLCLYSLASGNERPAAVWCANMSRYLFGAISFLFYFWLAAIIVRFWMRNIKRFSTMHPRRWLYFLGLFFFLALVLEYDANKHIPVIPPEEAGGHIAAQVVSMVTNVLGNSGMLILLVFLVLFFIWQAWKFLLAREREQSSKEQEVPVRMYWENVRTAAEAEEMEAEQRKAGPLTSDIEADFRSTVGLLSAQEPEEQKPSKDIRREAENNLRKLRETFKEISQPAPDKDSMIPKEMPKKKNGGSLSAADIKRQPLKEKPARRPVSRPLKPVQSELPLKGTPADEPDEVMLPEPVFENNDDPNGSGLLSAPAEKPAPKKEKQPEIQVRTHKVDLDEETAKVKTTPHDYSFVPTLPAEDKSNGTNEAAPDPWILPDTAKILDPLKQHKGASPDDPAIKAQAEKIERLLDTFGAPSQVVDIQCGPTFSQFGVEPGFVERGGRKTRVRIKQIEMLQKDLEMELSVKQLAIEAPIPGKTYVGVQIQNKT
ncbi:MAG: DNA translocase FtsK 4TM domain-containing protein, partial [Lentisphaeria bacterium]|nr:DNA translocase FtsK 4TM domain-containing protein [Lentisphaeria bacterium]